MYYLLLENSDSATDWFARSARHHLKRYLAYQQYAVQSHDQSHWENEPLILRNALNRALLSGDDELVAEIAETTREMDPEYKEHHKYTLYRYYYVKSLAALVSGDDRLEEYLRLFDEYAGDPRDEGNESLAEFFELLATALNEIYKRNVETVRDTLEGLLDRYATKVGTNPRISDRVYIPAAALLVLARRRGLAIEIDHEHLPQHIVELLE